MKKNFDEALLSDEAAFKKRFRRITRPAFLGDPRNPRPSKARITIYLDTDLVEHFKAEAADLKVGYQTLINRALRERMAGEKVADVSADEVVERLLRDRAALSRLKAELELV